MNKLSKPTFVAMVLIALAAFPFVAAYADASFYVSVVARIIIFAIAATALNLVFGYGGLVSLGHALFLGLGAYSVAIPGVFGISNGFAHLGICIVVCAVAGAATGAISLRTTGIGFIMITLAFAQMGYFAFMSLKQFGGDDGTPIAVQSTFGPLNLSNSTHLYLTALAVLVATTCIMAVIRVSQFGMALRGSSQNARRAGAMGFDVKRLQWIAYVLSAVMCGVAGMLLANLSAFASPATMSWFISGELIVMVVLGGVGTVFGPIVGALAFIGVEEAMKAVTVHWAAYFGVAIIAVAVAGKKGIVGTFSVSISKLRRAAT